MKKFFLLFIVHCSLYIVHCNAQWFYLKNNAYTHLYSVFFINKDTGFVAGGYGGGTGDNPGEILKTTDGGKDWSILYQDDWQALYSIYFLNPNKGFACGESDNFLENLLVTSDGGANWFGVNDSTNSSEELNQIFFIDTITGYIVGENGIILKTTDSGNKWRIIHKDSTEFLNSVYFINSDTGYVVGYGCNLGCSVILKTTNGGKNWVSVKSIVNGILREVYFTDINTGYIVAGGDTGLIKTTDSGNHWSVLYKTNKKIGFSSIIFTDVNTGYVVGGDSVGIIIMKTINAGNTWSIQKTDTTITGSLTSICFTDANIGYACGLGGVILKTTNGGGDWIKELGIINYKLGIFPNPVNDKLNIKYEISIKNDVKIEIFDLFGQLLLNRQFTKDLTQIDVSKFNEGIYIIKLTNDKTTIVKKFMKY